MNTTTAQSDLDQLEKQLLMLGRQELEVETKLHALRRRGREAAQAGKFAEADRLWSLHDEVKEALTALQSEVSRVERSLYALRRKHRG